MFQYPRLVGGKMFKTETEFTLCTFRTEADVRSTGGSEVEAFPTMSAVKSSFSNTLHLCKLSSPKSGSSKSGHTQVLVCNGSKGSSSKSCDWRHTFELCYNTKGEYVWVVRSHTGSLGACSKHDRANSSNPVAVKKNVPVKTKAKVRSTAILYNRDSGSLTQKFYATRARSVIARCIRCYNGIGKDELKLAFDSFDKKNNHPLSLSYHIACFARYPPKGFSTITWDDKKRNEECEFLVNSMLRQC